MAGFGGFNPFPMKFGNAKTTTLQSIREDLATSYGTALETEKDTPLGVEIEAESRVLWDLYCTAERFKYIRDPDRMSIEFLVRWENIYGIPKSDFDTIPQRRARLKAKMQFAHQPNTRGNIQSYLENTLGDVFVGFAFNNALSVQGYVPGGVAIPGGPTLLDGNLLTAELSPYQSKVAHIAVLLQKPNGMTEVEFYEKAGYTYLALDGAVGFWNTYDWVRDGENGAGFYLDEDHNLDNHRLTNT